MASSARARTYSISKSDMEASKLVFVFVRDAKPKRKVAVPVPEGCSWDDFLKQVKQKLKISGVKDVTLVSTGQKVTKLEELQDIDELCVTEGLEAARSITINPQGSAPAGTDGSSEISAGQPRPDAADSRLPPSPHRGVKASMSSSQSVAPRTSTSMDSDDKKYSRRTHPLKRVLQKWFPSLFTPSLPVSTKDVGGAQTAAWASGKKRKGRRGGLSMRNVLLLLAVATCVMTMMWLLMRATPNIS